MWWHLLLFRFVILRTFKILIVLFTIAKNKYLELVARIYRFATSESQLQTSNKVHANCIQLRETSVAAVMARWKWRCRVIESYNYHFQESHWLRVNDHQHSRSFSLEMSFWKSFFRVRRSNAASINIPKYCKNFLNFIIIASAIPQLENWLND